MNNIYSDIHKVFLFVEMIELLPKWNKPNLCGEKYQETPLCVCVKVMAVIYTDDQVFLFFFFTMIKLLHKDD